MSMITTYPFENETNYTLVNTNITLGGVGELALIDKTGLSFLQSFDSSSGFTFDPARTEFALSKMRQLNMSPTNSLIAATYNSTKDLNWRNDGGSLIGTLVGTPLFTGNKMICTGNQGVSYSRDSIPLETHKVKYSPNYTGAPPANVNIISTENGVDQKDKFTLSHSPAGNTLRITLFDNNGVSVQATTTIGAAWSPTAGQEYEIEVSLESISPGRIRVFIDGILHGTLQPGAWTRGTSGIQVYLGASPVLYNRAEGSFADYIMFSDIQHAADYTPGYSLVLTLYGEDSINIPNFSYTGLGFIQKIISLALTEEGVPHYTIEGKYWNGSSWISSDGSYAQSNTLSDMNTNLSTLNVIGQAAISMQVVFPDGNTQNSVDELTVSYTGQEYAAEGTILTNSGFIAHDLLSFDAVEIAPPSGVSSIKYIMNVNGIDYWNNGIDWVPSNGTSSESNTLAEVQANLGLIISGHLTMKIKVVLTSDGAAIHQIDTLTVVYDFGALEPTSPIQSQVYAFLKDSEGNPIFNATVTIKPYRDDIQYKEASGRIIAGSIVKTTDDHGFFSANLIISDEYEPTDFKYVMTITLQGQTDPIFLNGESDIVFSVPNQPSTNLTDLITAV